jgi:VanZ family protein
MNDSRNRGRGLHLLPLAVLGGYWLALCVATHVPPEFSGLPSEGYDKIVHFSAFVGLAALLTAVWWFFRGRLTVWSAVAVWLLIVTYAACDELTQPWFRRTCDIYDWRADACGAATGIALVYGWQMWRNARRRAATPAA